MANLADVRKPVPIELEVQDGSILPRARTADEELLAAVRESVEECCK